MITKTDRLVNVLANGEAVTPGQARNRCGFESNAAVASVVRNLRTRGVPVITDRAARPARYRIGLPSADVFAVGYQGLGGWSFNVA